MVLWHLSLWLCLAGSPEDCVLTGGIKAWEVLWRLRPCMWPCSTTPSELLHDAQSPPLHNVLGRGWPRILDMRLSLGEIPCLVHPPRQADDCADAGNAAGG